jgi:GxxExxY protein
MVLEYESLTGQVIAAGIAVHRELGPGFLERTYQAALCAGLAHRGIDFRTEVPFQVVFEGVPIGLARIDLIVADRVVVELKAVESLQPINFAQVRSYLRASRLRVGLLMNFNATVLSVRRIIVDPH